MQERKPAGVLEPLSESRRRLILSLKICTLADLRRARRHVRRLARDLPAFDSVWLDALVRIGRLTPFQSRILESSQPERIQVGPCLLVDRLGGGPLGETFLVSTGPREARCVMKRLSAHEKISPEAEELLEQLIENLRGLEHPSVAPPRICDRAGGELVIISRHVAGLHLGELLVRRGRFPAVAVWEIGRQLAEGLAALESRGVAHGDLRTANVRLTPGGMAVLVDTGIRGAVDPELSVHSGLPADRYDGVAPELIGSMARPTCASDMYALGCLLWQLLAGRPPFPGGDPLIKLAAHQNRVIEDVRKWAPETPPALAEGIRRMTARDSAERPAGYAEVLKHWGGPSRGGRRRLAAFRRWFDAPARTRLEAPPARSGRRWPMIAGMLFVVALAVFGLNHEGARSALLAWKARIPVDGADVPEGHDGEHATTFRPEPENVASPRSVTDEIADPLLELPIPDQQGIIRLPLPGPYRVREISVVGRLAIIGGAGPGAEIIVRDRPLKLFAESVRMENVRLRRTTPVEGTSRPPAALALIHAQSLDLERCVILSGGASSDRTDGGDAASENTGLGLAWKLVDPLDHQGGVARVTNTIVAGGDTALFVASPIRRVEFINCLRLGGGPLCHLALTTDSSRDTVIRMERTTCRAARALLRIAAPADGRSRQSIIVDADDCVFDLTPPAGTLFEFQGNLAPTDWGACVRLTGEGSLTANSVLAAVVVEEDGGPRVPLDPAAIRMEGILTGPYQFAGPISRRAEDAEVRDYEAPRRSTSPPGIVSAELPQRWE
jgi:serine/threonine protein kinase